MIHHTLSEIRTARAEGDGFCLNCGALHSMPDIPRYIGLCEECDHYAILSAEDVLRALELVEEEEEE